MKHNFKYNRKAFTLVELLIVIAIIGILFVVLVSKVDFATDKANTTGVQTDFRSFQIAFETVSRENAGFNTLGWDTGDKADASLIAGYTYENADKDGGDRIRNSYDKGDINLNGICEDGETWTGQKLYTETWTGIYTLDNPADATDMSAYLALERAINKNLDPALRISIDPENKTIYMANGYQDPWKTEYHGFYLSNAKNDGKDRGAIVMYSDGPNKVFGSEQTIANGVVTVTVKNGGINGQDDLSLVTCYTYTNGYGEIGTTTFGFSNNQQMQAGGGNGGPSVIPSQPITPGLDYDVTDGSGFAYDLGNPNNKVQFRIDADLDTLTSIKINNVEINASDYTIKTGYDIGDGYLYEYIEVDTMYLQELPTGNYTIKFEFDNGTADAIFSVEGVVCSHNDYEELDEYVSNGNSTHEVKIKCNDVCGREMYVTKNCSYWDDAHCNFCGEHCSHPYEYYEASGYVNGDGEGGHYKEFSCSRCHEYSIEIYEVCSLGTTIYSNENNETHKMISTCTICNDNTIVIEDHNYNSSMYCSVCGHTYCNHDGEIHSGDGEAIDGRYHVHYATCDDCGEDLWPSGQVEHDYYDEGSYYRCSVCNYTCYHDEAIAEVVSSNETEHTLHFYCAFCGKDRGVETESHDPYDCGICNESE